MSDFKFTLGCNNCHREASKVFNTTEQDMQAKARIAKKALRMPQHLICPGCQGIMCVGYKIERVA